MAYNVAGIDVHKKVLMVVDDEVSDQQHHHAEHFRSAARAPASEVFNRPLVCSALHR